ncbi:hypothetical protein L9F63_007167, partial [Diploptera punctata]
YRKPVKAFNETIMYVAVGQLTRFRVGVNKSPLYSAPKYCVGLAPMQSYMFPVITLLFDISFSAAKRVAGVFKWLACGFKCPAQCL